MRVLLTGATGFIGTAIARHLADRRYRVVGLHSRADAVRTGDCCEYVVADIGDDDSMANVAGRVEACDYIVHAAASLDMNAFSTEMSRVNCQGTQTILSLASQWACKRFVYLSSLPVIGLPAVLPILEDHAAAPRTAYHASKLFGEHLLAVARSHGVLGVSLRVSAPVGPGLPPGRLLAVLVGRACKHLPLELSGSGARRQNYVDVRDIADAVERSLTSDAEGVFNVAGSAAISNLELARACIRQCRSESSIVFNGMPDPEDAVSWEVSIEKARARLGYAPKYDIGDAIAAAMAAVQ